MLKHYATFYFPGLIVDESSSWEIPSRDAVGEIPERAHGYSVHDREEIEQDGEILRGDAKNHSPFTWLGEAFTLDEVRQRFPEERVLISNMEINGYVAVVRTRAGAWRALGVDDRVIAPAEAL